MALSYGSLYAEYTDFDYFTDLIVHVWMFQRVLVANTDFVVDRIRSRLDVVNAANLQSEKQSSYFDKFMNSMYLTW